MNGGGLCSFRAAARTPLRHRQVERGPALDLIVAAIQHVAPLELTPPGIRTLRPRRVRPARGPVVAASSLRRVSVSGLRCTTISGSLEAWFGTCQTDCESAEAINDDRNEKWQATSGGLSGSKSCRVRRRWRGDGALRRRLRRDGRIESHGRVKSKIAADCWKRPKPSSTMKPPIYMGLRTNLYGPATTNLRGGSNGAGVPWPRVTKVATQASAIIPPAVIRAMPRRRVQAGSAKARVVS